MSQQNQEMLLNNGLWFVASLVVAVLVWFVATIEANPIQERVFTRIEISIDTDEGMIVTAASSETARVIVRAQESTLQLLQTDDILVRANLVGMGPGTYTIPLQVLISRPASSDTQPAQITVSLERVVSQQKEIRIETVAPAVNYTFTLEQELFQVEVSGAPERVDAVAYVLAVMDLSSETEDVQRSLNLVPVDINGRELTELTIEPRTISVTAPIALRDDIVAVTVIPRILYGTLPADFTFAGVDYTPRTVFISSVNPRDLQVLGDTVLTEPVSLEDKTTGFDVTVPLDLPPGDYIVRDDENNIIDGNILVQIAIREETIQVPFDSVPVVLIGQSSNNSVRINPESLTVVLDGPVTDLQDVRLADLQAIIDISSLQAGTHEIEPTILIRQGQITLSSENITLLPPRITVSIGAQAEITPEATSTVED